MEAVYDPERKIAKIEFIWDKPINRLNMFGIDTRASTKGQSIAQPRLSKPSLSGADHRTGRPELHQAGNRSGMLSPSAQWLYCYA